jgi:hypothetical protein
MNQLFTKYQTPINMWFRAKTIQQLFLLVLFSYPKNKSQIEVPLHRNTQKHTDFLRIEITVIRQNIQNRFKHQHLSRHDFLFINFSWFILTNECLTFSNQPYQPHLYRSFIIVTRLSQSV